MTDLATIVKESCVRSVRGIRFPAFHGERVYMRRFTTGKPLPADLARWQDTVDACLQHHRVGAVAYLMIDEMIVKEGATHRRPGTHVDGWWDERSEDHGGSHGFPPRHRGSPFLPPSHRLDRHRGTHSGTGTCEQDIVLASNAIGCRAFVGEWSGEPARGGDCSHIDTDGMRPVTMLPGVAYYGDACSLLHESIPSIVSVQRQLIRINIVR